jgi:predicted metal-binding membrane protein
VSAGARALTARWSGIPAAVPLAIAAAWLLAIAAQSGGFAGSLHHDSLIHSNLPEGLALLLFLVAWQAMIVAMMLPSSLPLLRMFAVASQRQPRPRAAMASFLGGYALVWSAFGALAFMADIGIHATVDSMPWLQARPWLIAGGALALAGGFQFSSLKDACLKQCRHPGSYLMTHYERGAGGAFRLGRGHGIYCLGCCWALMLVMFAAGVASLWWMAALTAVMVYEKTAAGGRRAVPYVGVVLLVLSAVVLAGPALLSSPG